MFDKIERLSDVGRGKIALCSYFFITYILSIFLVVFLAIVLTILGVDFDKFSQTNSFNMIANIFIYLLLLLSVGVIYYKIIIKDFKSIIKDLEEIIAFFVTIVVAYILYFIGVIVVSELIKLIAETGTSDNQAGIESMTEFAIPLFFMTVIMAPIVEELVFRKAIFSLIKNPVVAFIMSSLFFAIIHFMSSLMIGNFDDLINIYPYILMGIAMSSVYVGSKKNIVYPIGLHMLNNFIAFTIMILV